ncbi:50S ribosomal protein L10 [Porphyromonas miyakawae]|uniref:Large ribosomal subunit protein uL10 n=1 Tax=Porphyromonas miyakawae TaxID=3137470 RepID=A0ABQ0E0U7_9PORP
MRKELKGTVVKNISGYLSEYPHFYLVDVEALNAENTMELRRLCNKNEVKLVVVKNTLLRRALADCEGVDFSELYGSLKGNTAMMLSNNANAPAKIIKEFASQHKELGKPALKAAYVQESFYVGGEHLEQLIAIKSREELLAEVILLLQSPIKNVVSALGSAGQTVHGLLKTLEEREAN